MSLQSAVELADLQLPCHFPLRAPALRYLDRDDSYTIHWRGRLVGPAYEAGKSFKQTAMETLDGVHVGKKRKTSDISFACQGVANEQLDRYQVSEQSSSDEEDVLVPDPLFYAKNAGMDRKFS